MPKYPPYFIPKPLPLQTSITSLFTSSPKFVSLLLTESVASTLNVRAQHLQDLQENSSKSTICVGVLMGKSQDGRKEGKSKLPVNDNVALYRLVPMEESSTSVYGMDDLSIKSRETIGRAEKKTSLYLVPQFVNTNSIMAICSIAHEGNLYTDLDKVYVRVQETDLPLSNSGWVNMCRICHGTDSVEELIGPCRCRGSVALAHLSCLERWLRESSRSRCELCLHHYEIKREPKYTILKSVLIWMATPGEHRRDLLHDLLAFAFYSPAAIGTTYVLMLIGEHAAKNCEHNINSRAHVVMFCTIMGIAAIDFSYSSWFMLRFQHHLESWKAWYRENCCLTLILPPRKRRRRCAPNAPDNEHQEDLGNDTQYTQTRVHPNSAPI